MSHEEHEKWLLNGHQDALERFKACVHDRQVDAYLKGRDDATDQQAQRAYFMRSAVLLLVVLAVVSLPIIAIGLHIDPQEFGAYVAPVTGIAGTVVGYWFGTGKQHQCCDR